MSKLQKIRTTMDFTGGNCKKAHVSNESATHDDTYGLAIGDQSWRDNLSPLHKRSITEVHMTAATLAQKPTILAVHSFQDDQNGK